MTESSMAAHPADFLRPQAQERWRQGLVMALAAHGLLVVALMFHMNWKTQPVEVIEAEVWADVPLAAQPVARVAPPPEPKPEPPPEPEPEPTPVPKPAPEPVPEPEPPKPAEVSVARKPAPKEAPKEAPRETPKEPPKEVRKESRKEAPQNPPKQVAKEAPKELPKEPPKERVKPSATLTPAQIAQQERERQERLRRMMADLGGEGAPSAGPSAAYAGRIKARIKPNIVFTDELSGNPSATVEVQCAPDGRIIGRRLLTRSGVSAWDDAVLRAIDRTEVLPLDEKGKVPAVMQISFRPHDF